MGKYRWRKWTKDGPDGKVVETWRFYEEHGRGWYKPTGTYNRPNFVDGPAENIDKAEEYVSGLYDDTWIKSDATPP